MTPADVFANEYFSYMVVYSSAFMLFAWFVGFTIRLIVALLYKIIR